MPELPEVETIARGVNKRIRGDRIVQVWFSRAPQTFKTPRKLQAEGLTGRTILAVHRTGKHIVFELSRSASEIDAQWIVHLGMTGRLLVSSPDFPVPAHTHARLFLESGRELRFVDPRRFGRLEFRDLNRRSAFAAPGDDPLAIGEPEFAALFRGRRSPIKAALLNQSLLAGVGNIYADESLFHSNIRPRRRANRLTRLELERLRLALCEVLNHAIRLGGSSVSDYVDADGERGFFQLEHCVYQRTGEPCRRCGTPIRRILLAGRGTHYCPNCQR
ncbi:MAG TPA: bifunctional DNA-formamidopyrimidine glycosylase/DNA-(apurinic or apyrimidinic site) lyase [Terracidiphilus sp.]|nr:bifunctional DNA-formamidopyrimidine glycosylase/DNA-(apurinic or apyrimidinic site) lyase [Terracidiphilus sp.]